MFRNDCFSGLLITGGILAFSGCAVQQQNYYVSPFNGNNTDYHTLPSLQDSVKTAVYAKALFLGGDANDNNTDHYTGARAGIYVAHCWPFLQCYGGLDLTAGDYFMGKWAVDSSVVNYAPSTIPSGWRSLADRTESGDLPYAAMINTYSRGYFFGGAGFQAGVNGVIPVKRGPGSGEWRFLGVETSLYREFGHYLSFRQQLPDSLADLIARSRVFGTIGLTSEAVRNVRDGEFGLRWAYGWVLGDPYNNPGIFDNENQRSLRYNYFNMSFHFTYRQVTGWLQLQTATKASGVLAGVNYRLWAHAPKRTDTR